MADKKRIWTGILTGGMSELINFLTGSANMSEAWDKFRNGEANQINKEQAEKERVFNEEQNKLSRDLETKLTQETNQANKDIQSEVNKTNIDINNQTNDMNLAIARETNALNKSVADQNLAFQRENLEYQKALQQQIFDREDTSYQRTALDMAKAGLNPLSMNGTNGAGSVVSTTPQENTMQYQSAMMNPTQVQGYQHQKSEASKFVAQYSKFNALSAGIMDIFNTLNGVSSTMNNLMSGNAQRDLLQEQINGSKLDNALKLQGAGYISPYFNDIPYVVPRDSDGHIIQPKDFKNWNNPDSWYDPTNKYINDKMPFLRQNQNDFDYNLFNNSTQFERNLTSINRLANNGMLEDTAKDVGLAAKNLIGQFLKALNISF